MSGVAVLRVALARFIACIAVLVSFGALGGAAYSAEKIMIVLDGSGSMWGQIDGVAKISIARDVLRDVLRESETGLNIGLMSYGHRQKGQCSDIELLVAPQSGSAAAISEAADAISPLGKTPLSDSVQMAAELLKYEQEPATIILITDGIETCDADPCALAAALEESGVDFTTHVVGFGLSAEEGQQVACLAQETGGLYVPAGDAEALGTALAETVQEIILAGEPVELEATPEPAAEEPVELPEVAINVPSEVVIGLPFDVSWEGPPPHQRDALEIYEPDVANEEGAKHFGRRIVNGDVPNMRVALIAPIVPGPYVVRYVFGDDRTVVAEIPFEAIEARAALDAPATVDIGLPFDVTWKGPGTDQDYVYIVDTREGADGEPIRGQRLVNGDFANRLVTIEAPAEPGFYQLRYWNNRDREILATREIEILDAEVALDAPAEVPIGTTFDVAWTGPGATQDYVELVDAAENRIAAKRVSNGDVANRIVDLVAPAAPGDYLLRYYNGRNRAVLATRPISVTELTVALTAPDSAPIATTITVGWQGPGAVRDMVQIWDPAASGLFHAVRLSNGDMDAKTVEIRLPVVPGPYELRYYNGDSQTVLATRPFEVAPMEVSLTAPTRVPAGEPFEVGWTGPGANRDSVTLSIAGGREVTSTRLISGGYDARLVQIKAPDEPGDYVLRYWNGDNSVALYERPVVLE